MKEFKVLIFLTVLMILIGCGAEKTDQSPKTAATDTALTDENKIRAALTELIERVMEGDKNVLYENEFSYYTDETSLSDYMKLARVINYAYDTLRGIEIDSINIMGDSALVDTRITYESKAGGEFTKEYKIMMYNFDGKWVKPYMSRADAALEYLKSRRAYDSAVAAQEARKSGK